MLTNPPSMILQRFLYDVGGVITLPTAAGDWPCFAGKLPDDPGTIPNDVVAIFDTTPIVHQREMQGGTYPIRFGNQIQVRSTVYPTAWVKIKEIQFHLLSIYKQQVDMSSAESFLIQSVGLETSIVPIGFDETGRRHVLVFNVTSIIEEK